MIEVLGSLLPHAIAIALNPLPTMGLIVMLTAAGGRQKAWSFILGALLGLFAIAIVVELIAATKGVDESDSGASTVASLIKLALGLLLFFMAYRYWKKMPSEGETAEVPGWIKAIERMSIVKTFGFGLIMMALKPKNIIILAAASLSIAEAGLSTSTQWITVAIFTFLSISPLIILALAPVIFGARGDAMLASVGKFMERYSAAIMIVIFLILGALLVGNGITGLTG